MKIETTNALAEPLQLDLNTILKALTLAEHAPDTVCEVAMSSTAIKEMIEPNCTFKSDEPKGAIMGIKLVAYDHMPKHLAMLTHTSGKRVVLNLSDGKMTEIPNPTKIPDFEFEHRSYSHQESRHFSANPWWPND